MERQNYLETEPSRLERLASVVMRPIVRVFDFPEPQDLKLSPVCDDTARTTAREEGVNAFFNIGVSGLASSTQKRKD